MARHGLLHLLKYQLQTPEHLLVEQYNICNPVAWLIQDKFRNSVKWQMLLYPLQLKLLLNNFELSWNRDGENFCYSQQIKPKIMTASVISRYKHESIITMNYMGKTYRAAAPTISCIHDKYRIGLRATLTPKSIDIVCPVINVPMGMIDAPANIKQIIKNVNKNYKAKSYPLDKLGGPGLSTVEWAEIMFVLLGEEIDGWF